MNLRQLVYFQEVIRQDFNISSAAKVLHTSQPGVSRQLRDLASELGVDLFRHQGKRLVGLTRAGAEISEVVESLIRDVKRVKSIAASHAIAEQGDLTIVVTRHAAANRLQQALVRSQTAPVRRRVRVVEGDPDVAIAKLRSGDASLGILTEPAERDPDLLYFPLDRWGLLLAVPQDHPLARLPEVTLESVARYPCCSYEDSARSRQVVEDAFRAAGLTSPVAFSLGSSEKILDYVEAGVGIGIVASAAFVPEQHPTLRALDASHLFRRLTTELVLPRWAPLSKEVLNLVRLLDSTLTRARIEAARRDADTVADERA